MGDIDGHNPVGILGAAWPEPGGKLLLAHQGQSEYAIVLGQQASPSERWAELRSYVLAKLLWNPDCQVDPLVDEFLAGVYGEARQPLRAYFDLLHEQVADPEQHFFIYSGPSVGYLSAAVLAQTGRHPAAQGGTVL